MLPKCQHRISRMLCVPWVTTGVPCECVVVRELPMSGELYRVVWLHSR